MRRTLYTLCLALSAGWLLPPTAQAQQRSEAEALTAAQGFLNRKHQTNVPTAKLKLADLPVVGLAKVAGTSNTDAHTDKAYYFVEDAESNELVIVSGDYRMPEVLGYTQRRSSAELPEGLRHVLDVYQEQYELVQTEPFAKPFAKSITPRSTAAVPEIKQKLLPTAEWGTQAPFNKLLPEGHNVPSLIVAAAAIMDYHQWPAQGKNSVGYTDEEGNEQSYDFSQSHYDWTSLPARFDEGSYTEVQAEDVAKVMYDVSLGAQVEYKGGDGSSFSTGNLREMFFKYFSYYPGIKTQYSADITKYMEDIDANRPVLYCAYNTKGTSVVGFVIDGYYNEFAHINWCNNGDYNGYYILYNAYKGDAKYRETCFSFFHIEPDTLAGDFANLAILPNPANTYTGLISTHTDIQAGKPFGLYISQLDYLGNLDRDSAAVVLCSADGQVKDWLAYRKLSYLNRNIHLSCNPTVDAAEGDYITLRGKRGDGADWKPLRPLKEGTDCLPAVGYEPPHVQLQTDVEKGLEIENPQPDLLYQGNPILFHPYVCSVKLPEGKDVVTFQIDDKFYAPDSIVDGKVYYTSVYTDAEPHKLSIHALAESEMVKGLHFTLGQGQTLEEYIRSVTDRPETVAELTLAGPLVDNDRSYLFENLLYLRHLDLSDVHGYTKRTDFFYNYKSLPLLFLTDFQLPKALKNVSLYASNLPLLKSITFPADFKKANPFSLQGSNALREINSLAVVPPTINKNSLLPQQVAEEAVLHVPVGSKVEYEDADFWNRFQNIVEDLPARDAFFTVDEFNYEVEMNADVPNEVVVTGCNRTDERLEIPAEVEFGGMRYDVAGIASAAFYKAPNDTIILPSSIRDVQYNAFWLAQSSCIQLNDELETISNNCFGSCYNLHDVHWPKNLRKIEDYAFSESSLDSIILPDKVTYVGNEAFWCCNNAKRIHLPPMLEYIGEAAFDCGSESYLDNTVLPSTLKYLGDYAFWYIAFQQTDVVLPASLEYYGDEALSWNIIVGFKVEEGNTILRCENGMLLDADNRRLNQYARPDTLVDLKVPEGVETIAMAVGFKFDKIKTLSLPSTLTLVKDAAFGKCGGLTDVTIHALVPPVIESFNYYPFEDCYDKATLHVPAEALSNYQSHPFWSRFTNIEAIDPSAINTVEAEAIDSRSVQRVCGDYANLSLTQAAEVEVYDAAGRQVMVRKLSAGNHNLALPAKGVYILKWK